MPNLPAFPGITNNAGIETTANVNTGLASIRKQLDQVISGYAGIFGDGVPHPEVTYWKAIDEVFDQYSYPKECNPSKKGKLDGENHGPGHLLRVMFLALNIYEKLPLELQLMVDIRAVIMAAAYHDIWSATTNHNLWVWWNEGNMSAAIFDAVQNEYKFNPIFYQQIRDTISNHPGRTKRHHLTPELAILTCADVLDQSTIGRWSGLIQNLAKGITSYVSWQFTKRTLQQPDTSAAPNTGLILINNRNSMALQNTDPGLYDFYMQVQKISQEIYKLLVKQRTIHLADQRLTEDILVPQPV